MSFRYGPTQTFQPEATMHDDYDMTWFAYVLALGLLALGGLAAAVTALSAIAGEI